MLPLYENNTRNWEKLFTDTKTAHIGLLFDKFPHGEGWADKSADYQPAVKIKDKDKEKTAKQIFLESIIKKYDQNKIALAANLSSAIDRQHKLATLLQGQSLTVTTQWRLVSGLGASHPFETGFIWHRTLSVPYLPGSSIKGMMRAWAEQWGGLDDQNEINRLFGPRQKNGDSNDNLDPKAESGAIIIFDALPTKFPELELDILNPHYSKYYQNPATPPADYLSPIPVFFLTVASGQDFEFFLAPRKSFYQQHNDKNWQTDLDKAQKLLVYALATLGAGGKTAVGYGQMIGLEYKQQQLAEEAKLWLDDTIASLKNDKDLKGASEENLWKKPLSERWLVAASAELRPLILELVKAKWEALGINWDNPQKGSAETAKHNFTK